MNEFLVDITCIHNEDEKKSEKAAKFFNNMAAAGAESFGAETNLNGFPSMRKVSCS